MTAASAFAAWLLWPLLAAALILLAGAWTDRRSSTANRRNTGRRPT